MAVTLKWAKKWTTSIYPKIISVNLVWGTHASVEYPCCPGRQLAKAENFKFENVAQQSDQFSTKTSRWKVFL